jgi:hypothetical protein
MVSGPQQVSAYPKEIRYEAVHGCEALHLGGRLEAPHLTLALACRLMGNFGSIVGVLVRGVDHERHHGPTRRRITAQLVRDQTSRNRSLAFQQLPEEARGGTPITPGLHEDVDYIAVLVDRPPKILLPTLNIDEQFVQVPRVAHPPAASPQRSSIRRPEGPTPLPNRFVGDRHTALGQQILRIAEAETKAVVEPDGVTDDLGRESIAVIAGGPACHRPTLPARAST